MAMCKQGDVSLCGAGFGDNPIDPRTDLFWRLPAWAAIAKNHPVRSFRMNLLWGKPLVLPIVPLHQIALDMRTVAESRQLAGLAGAVERAGQDESERFFGENGLEKSGGRAPIVRERNIRHAGMLPAQAPLGFAVAHQINLLISPCHGSIFRGAFVYSLNLKNPPLTSPPSETVSQFENSEDGGKLQTYFGRKQRCHPYIRFVRHSKWDSFMFISLRRLIATQSPTGERSTSMERRTRRPSSKCGAWHRRVPRPQKNADKDPASLSM